ncbi:FAD-dependent oxidoreductase [Kineosporia sp. R_H_3]|uniref:FAD-dependent oxidoreductase n=1 Tax=Kineosporia sp. R_H_3 TaxID=1961848 RepID=UPI000B4BEBB7|nr:FAD-dependent oxidoreductase [Kineosporia sp. R_H_3]
MTAPAPLPDRARVVVVGGGNIGCSVAYHLTRLGVRDVLVLERHELTSGTTWHAAGLITSAGMGDETSLWMARYSRDLYARLEAETGHSTGFRATGHLHLATNPDRLATLRRESAWQRGLGVDNVEVSRAEVDALWPIGRTDDVLAAFYVADEGRADPVGCATALAKGARAGGATVVEGVRVTGFETTGGGTLGLWGAGAEGRRVTAVLTDAGRVECETVVLAAGLWSRQVAALAGVDVPLQAAEHYYLLTDPVPGVHRDLPVVEDPDRYGYYREEAGGMLVGLFEPVAGPWHVEGAPDDFAFGTIRPDWDRVGDVLAGAMERVPSLDGVGVRTFFCGPESFTPDLHPMLGPTPEVDNVFVAAGLNSLGILLGGGVGSVVAQWVVDGVPPVDVTHYGVERALPHETTRRFRAERTVEQLGALFGDAAFPAWQPASARGVRRTPLHERLAAAGARFGVSAGWEYPLWFAPPGTDPADVEVTRSWGRQPWHAFVAAEHRAVREAVGVLDLTLMSTFLVQGRDAAALLDRVSAGAVAGDVGRVVYTQWLDDRGGILADVTVTRLADDEMLVVSSDVTHRRLASMLRRARRDGEHAVVTDVTAGTALLSVQGPRSRDLLARLTPDDVSDAAWPYLTARRLEVGYARVLALRVTYVGELGFELHVPADLAVSVWDSLFEAGAELGIRPVGLAAMESLRLEKGYRDYGVDIENTDGVVEAGLGFAVALDKAVPFAGRDAVLAARTDRTRRMVHVLLDDPEPLLHGGEPLLHNGSWVGYLRAGAFGHTLGAGVGLAMCEHDGGDGVTAAWLAAGGFEVDVAGTRVPATCSLRPFYDPGRSRVLG